MRKFTLRSSFLTFNNIFSCFRKQQSGFKRKGMIVKEKSPLHQIYWHRIIVRFCIDMMKFQFSVLTLQLDEAHNIKERATNTAKAAFELRGKYRWCLSGTPLQNRVGELYSLIRFLGSDPFSYYFCKNCRTYFCTKGWTDTAMWKAKNATANRCIGGSATSDLVTVRLLILNFVGFYRTTACRLWSLPHGACK